MNDFLPEAVRQGLDAARKEALKRKDRLCVHDGEMSTVSAVFGTLDFRLILMLQKNCAAASKFMTVPVTCISA